MKYSVRGNLSLSDEATVVDLLNNYIMWRLFTESSQDEEGNNFFTFEVWLNDEVSKDDLFLKLKPYVDQYGEAIDWHECTHDEVISQPCVIMEEYRKPNML